MNKLLQIGEMFTAYSVPAQIVQPIVAKPMATKSTITINKTIIAVVTIGIVVTSLLIAKKYYESPNPSNKQ